MTENIVRSVTPDDIEWGIALAGQHYSQEFDETAVRAWAHQRLSHPEIVFLRTDHAFGAANLAMRYSAPTRPQAYLTLLYAEKGVSGFELLRLINGLKEWALSKGATKFWLGDITGHDMGPLISRIGGVFAGSTYVVDLAGDGRRFN